MRAVMISSPQGRAARGTRAGTTAAYGAAALAFAYAAVSLYWTAGGVFLLGTVGGAVEEIARRGGLPAIALGLAATLLKVGGGVLALALARPWWRVAWRRWLLALAGVAGVALACYGALQVTIGTLVLAGVIHPAGAVDRGALRWHVALWDPWFLVWGVLLTAATVASWRAPDCVDPHDAVLREALHQPAGLGHQSRSSAAMCHTQPGGACPAPEPPHRHHAASTPGSSPAGGTGARSR